MRPTTRAGALKNPSIGRIRVTNAKSETTRVRYSVHEHVAILTLSDPPANCYTYELMQDLDAAIMKARFDPAVDVIVLTGDGERFFCAGADIAMLSEVTPQFKYNFCMHANETLHRLEQTPKLVIAALNGHTVGGGLEVALACDLRIAWKGHGKVGLPEVSLGVLPGTGGTQRLPRLIGKSKALEMMVGGDLISMERAAEIGLVNQVFEGDDFQSQVLDYAQKMARPHKAPLAVGLIKRAVHTGVELPFSEALALERELQQQLFMSEDAKEGLNAFHEKRTPVFRGK